MTAHPTTIHLGRRAAHDLFDGVADALARADLDQEDRERLAENLAEALASSRLATHFANYRRVFVLLASDPLVPCAGYDLDDGTRVECPHGRAIRIAMHLGEAPDGRSAAWEHRAPYGRIRCVTCGSMQFNPEYRRNVLAREASP